MPSSDAFAKGVLPITLEGPSWRIGSGEMSISLGNRTVRAGSGPDRRLARSIRRASIRAPGAVVIARRRGFSNSPTRWAVNDELRSYELHITREKQSERPGVSPAKSFAALDRREGHVAPQKTDGSEGRSLSRFISGQLADSQPVAWGDLRRVWRHDAQLVDGRSGHLIGALAVVYAREEQKERSSEWGMPTGDIDYRGSARGQIRLDEPVPVATVALMLRLTLGRWAIVRPRTGRWRESKAGTG